MARLSAALGRARRQAAESTLEYLVKGRKRQHRWRKISGPAHATLVGATQVAGPHTRSPVALSLAREMARNLR